MSTHVPVPRRRSWLPIAPLGKQTGLLLVAILLTAAAGYFGYQRYFAPKKTVAAVTTARTYDLLPLTARRT